MYKYVVASFCIHKGGTAFTILFVIVPCRTAVKDRIVGFLLFLGKIVIVAVIGQHNALKHIP